MSLPENDMFDEDLNDILLQNNLSVLTANPESCRCVLVACICILGIHVKSPRQYRPHIYQNPPLPLIQNVHTVIYLFWPYRSLVYIVYTESTETKSIPLTQNMTAQ